jgi:hypothetical protein
MNCIAIITLNDIVNTHWHKFKKFNFDYESMLNMDKQYTVRIACTF